MDQYADRLGHLLSALRSRATGVGELATQLGLDRSTTLACLADLETWGLLSVTGEVITYRRPETALADLTIKMLDEVNGSVASTMAKASSALASLPQILQAWDRGVNDDHQIQVEVTHGPWAPADMWMLQMSRKVPRVSWVCMPDTAALFEVLKEYQSSFWADRAGEPIEVRLLMSVTDACNPDAQDRIQGELDAGVEIRMHPNPPSFFWTTDHDTVGVPLEWGQSWPRSVMALRSPVLAGMASWAFDQIWHQSLPVRSGAHRWEPMLQMMNRGLTMESASIQLGLSTRTGRRRVTEAMNHFGVDSHFALGAAWAATRDD